MLKTKANCEMLQKDLIGWATTCQIKFHVGKFKMIHTVTKKKNPNFKYKLMWFELTETETERDLEGCSRKFNENVNPRRDQGRACSWYIMYSSGSCIPKRLWRSWKKYKDGQPR